MISKKAYGHLVVVFAIICIWGCKQKLPCNVQIPADRTQLKKFWNCHNIIRHADTVLFSSEQAELVSRFTVRDFSFSMKVRTTKGAEGTLEFHIANTGDKAIQGYSVKINNSDYRQGSSEKTGSLSMIRNYFVRTVNDNEWFDMAIHVTANHIRVLINNHLVSDYVEPPNAARIKNLSKRLLSEGLIRIRKTNSFGLFAITEMQIRCYEPEKMVPAADPFVYDSTGEVLNNLNQQGFPLIDFHCHLKGGLTVEQVAEHGRINGYNLGIAPNCGLNFPVTNDTALLDWYNHMKDAPVFKAMQCEGREWITLFTPDAISRYDYIFTDAMTFTDRKGRRMRLWIPEETFIENEQEFMDMLTDKIVSELSQEPVDIYVNPTYLPEKLSGYYDVLWTEKRMERVIRVLAENDVALEINSRFKIPSVTFVKKAKQAGVKFTVGTNNAGNDDLGRLDYSIHVIKEAGLTPDDMFLPRSSKDKKVMKKGLPIQITG